MAQGSAGGALIAAAVILGGSLIGGSYLVANSIDRGASELASLRSAVQTAAAEAPAARPSPSRSRRPDPEKVYRIAVADAPTKGPKSAAITLVEWSDFQ